jgi:hypothetical protein
MKTRPLVLPVHSVTDKMALSGRALSGRALREPI